MNQEKYHSIFIRRDNTELTQKEEEMRERDEEKNESFDPNFLSRNIQDIKTILILDINLSEKESWRAREKRERELLHREEGE